MEHLFGKLIGPLTAVVEHAQGFARVLFCLLQAVGVGEQACELHARLWKAGLCTQDGAELIFRIIELSSRFGCERERKAPLKLKERLLL